MCAIPAGMDISERIAGIIRPKKYDRFTVPIEPFFGHCLHHWR